MSEHYVGQISEYGSQEYNDNRSNYTELEKAIYVNPHNIERPVVFYTRSEGYKPAGSCATWTKEVWGYSIYQNDGTTTGRFSSNQETAREWWKNLSKKNLEILK